MTSSLGLPRNVKEEAARVYRCITEKGFVKGTKIESVVAASVYISCRKYQVPRTLGEVARASGLGKGNLARVYRSIRRRLNIKTTPVSPEEYIPRFASELFLNGETQSRAIAIIKAAKEKDLICGRAPAGAAAAAIYMAAGINGEFRPQRDVAEACDVTEVTIRSRYKELSSELGLELKSLEKSRRNYANSKGEKK